MIQVKVISPFSMDGKFIQVGEILEVTDEQAKSMVWQKLVEISEQVKAPSKPRRDKQVKRPPVKK